MLSTKQHNEYIITYYNDTPLIAEKGYSFKMTKSKIKFVSKDPEFKKAIIRLSYKYKSLDNKDTRIVLNEINSLGLLHKFKYHYIVWNDSILYGDALLEKWVMS